MFCTMEHHVGGRHMVRTEHLFNRQVNLPPILKIVQVEKNKTMSAAARAVRREDAVTC